MLSLAGVCHAVAVTSNGTGGGLWSDPATWAGKSVPANGDSVTIAPGDTVTFDVNMATWAGGIAGLTCNGTMNCSKSAGTYGLKTSADIGGTGLINCGSPEAVYPSDCTMIFDFDAKPNSFECGSGLTLHLHCTPPAHPVVALSQTAAAGQTELSVDTDVRADTWGPNKVIRVDSISNSGPDSELRTIGSGGITATTITVGAGLTNAKTAGARVVLVTRNIRISGSTDYAVKAMTGGVLGCEISGCTRAVTSCSGSTISGTISGCTNGISYTSGCLISAVVSACGYGVAAGAGDTVSGTISGCSYGVSSCCGSTVSGTISGCAIAVIDGSGCRISSLISGCTTGVYYSSGCQVLGEISGCGSGIYAGSNTMQGTIFSGNTHDLRRVVSGSAYHTVFGSAVDNYEYDTEKVPAWSYVASYDHDGVPGNFKAWTRGGVIVSDGDTAPVGYSTSYMHACTSAAIPCFRQELVTVGPNQTLAVRGKILILDDHTAWPPRLEIIDVQADPLVDAGKEALASAAIPSPRGRYYWQDVTVEYTNVDPVGRQVWIRCSAHRPGSDIYEVWTKTISP